jgi:hypothetical protein
MAEPHQGYRCILVESYRATATSGLHGEIHIRPVAGQGFPTELRVRCNKNLSIDYPVGTRFEIKAKLTNREGGRDFIHSDYRWPFAVIQKP